MGVRVEVRAGIFYLSVYSNGRRKYESLHFKVSSDPFQQKENERIAEICRSKREAQLLCHEFDIEDSQGGRINFYKYCTDIAKTKKPKDHLRKCLKYLEKFPGGKTIKLNQISREWVETFQQYLSDCPALAPCTVSHYDGAIRLVLHQAVREKRILTSPADNVKAVKVPEKVLDILTEAEIQALINTPIGGVIGAEAKKAFLFGVFTGLRISDIKALTWGSVEDSPPSLRLIMQKTQRFLEIPLLPEAIEIIGHKQGHKKEDLVFPVVGTTGTNMITYFKIWAKHAEVQKNISWHTGRRTFATIAVKYGIDQYVVSKLLGHTTMRHTAVYSQVPLPVKENAIKRLPTFDLTNIGD